MPDFYVKRNDTSEALNATLTDANGAAVNLTGASVQFHMKSVNGGAVKVDAAATIVSASAGTVRHSWLAAHTDTAGLYHAEFEVTFSGGAIQTFPNSRHLEILVYEDVN